LCATTAEKSTAGHAHTHMHLVKKIVDYRDKGKQISK